MESVVLTAEERATLHKAEAILMGLTTKMQVKGKTKLVCEDDVILSLERLNSITRAIYDIEKAGELR